MGGGALLLPAIGSDVIVIRGACLLLTSIFELGTSSMSLSMVTGLSAPSPSSKTHIDMNH